MSHAPTHLDLFSGIGGFSLAAEHVGFRTIAFAENDKAASCVLSHHWPGVPNLGDVTKLCRRIYDCEYEGDGGQVFCPRCQTEFGECACIGTDQFTDSHGFPDLITGGVPCQPASALGQMRGSADPRWLWPEAIRIVRELRPSFAVFENPPNILVLEGGRAWNGIVSGLVAGGYDLWWDVFPAAAFGAGHLRERLLLVCADSQGKQKSGEHDDGSCGVARPSIQLPQPSYSGSEHVPAYTSGQRFQGHAGNGQRGGNQWRRGEEEGRYLAPPDLRGRVNGSDWWHEAHTGVPVLADGLSARLVEAATRCAGNAVVPQAVIPVLQAIRQTFRLT